MDYDLETEIEDEYFHIRIAPKGNTTVGELAGRMEKNGLEYVSTIGGYEAEADLAEDSIEITLDTETGDESPDALVAATEEVRGYLEDEQLPDDFVDRFRGGTRQSDSFRYK